MMYRNTNAHLQRFLELSSKSELIQHWADFSEFIYLYISGVQQHISIKNVCEIHKNSKNNFKNKFLKNRATIYVNKAPQTGVFKND